MKTGSKEETEKKSQRSGTWPFLAVPPVSLSLCNAAWGREILAVAWKPVSRRKGTRALRVLTVFHVHPRKRCYDSSLSRGSSLDRLYV